MFKYRPSCRILKRLNVINVKSEYFVKRVNFLSCLRFIYYKDVVFKKYDLDLQTSKSSILTSKFDILRVLVSIMFMCFSNVKMVQWQSLGYS